MSLVYCGGGGSLVSGSGWIPPEPFDYGWGSGWDVVGCNNLRCNRCGGGVRWRLEEGKSDRVYWCSCDGYDAHQTEPLKAYAGPEHFFQGDWECAGHPALELPAVLDGVELPALGPYEEIVSEALLAPPFVPPGYGRSSTYWVERLFHLMPTEAQKAMVARAVASLLSSEDARLVRGALAFFTRTWNAPGREELLVVAHREGERLRAMRDSELPSRSMYDSFVSGIQEWLLYGADVVSEGSALARARAVLLSGGATAEACAGFAWSDPRWFYRNAEAIVRGQPAALAWVLEELMVFPSSCRLKPLTAMRTVGKEIAAEMKQWFEQPRQGPKKPGAARGAPR